MLLSKDLPSQFVVVGLLVRIELSLIADFIRDREPSLVRLNFLACLRNLDLPDMIPVHALSLSPSGAAPKRSG